MLTPRERGLCLLLALGYSNVEIARRLETSARTVGLHRRHVMNKLGFRRRVELVEYALKCGLLGFGAMPGDSKQCPSCRVLWHSCDELLADRAIRFIGYQPAPGVERPGFLLFTHAPCQTSLALALESFGGLTREPIFAESGAVRSKEEHCLRGPELQPCPPKCVCQFVGRISRMITHWPKSRNED